MNRRVVVAVLALCVLFACPSYAALASTVQWDVRTTGVDTNGGGFDPGVSAPGTDFSQQNSAQVAFTDLIIGATTTQLTSAGNPFSSTSPGNLINITSGTGCTTGWFEVLSVTGVTATMDRSVGTAASTCNGNLGGALLTISKAFTAGRAVTGNTIHVKSGTYSFAAEQDIPNINIVIRGYNTAHNDYGAQPVYTTASNAINGVQVAGGGELWFDNMALTATGGSNTHTGLGWSGSGGQLFVTRSFFSGWGYTAILVDSGNFGQAIPTYIWDSEFTSIGGSQPVIDSNSSIVIDYSYIHANTTSAGAVTLNGPAGSISRIENTVFVQSTNSSNTVAIIANSGSTIILVSHSLFYNWAGSGGGINAHGESLVFEDCAFYNVAGTAVAVNSGAFVVLPDTNAFGANGTNLGANVLFSGKNQSNNQLALTADPTVNGGSSNFQPNSTAGGGAVLRNAAIPSTPAGQAGATFEDVGPIRHQDPAGSTTSAYTFSSLWERHHRCRVGVVPLMKECINQ